MTQITFNALSSRDVARAIIELKTYKIDLQRKFNELMQALTDKGVEIAKDNLSLYDMPFATGELESSIKGIYDPKTGRGAVFSDCGHALYFEFGTGLKGKLSPHPGASKDGYSYDINEHVEKGWWYFTDKFHWTQGMPSRPFMWDTAQQLAQEVGKTAQEIFNRD